MSERELPCFGNVGQASSPEHEAAVRKGCRDLIAVFNAVPDTASMDALCSMILTVCVNQPDPYATLGEIARRVGHGIPEAEKRLHEIGGHG